MPQTYRRKYGIDWPVDLQDEMIELHIAKKWKFLQSRNATLDRPGVHLLRGCRMLLTPDQFGIHKWTEQHAEDFTESDFCITWGAAATSKSNDYGLFVLVDWLCDPTQTMALLGSTTKDSLKKRSWESILRYFAILKSHPKIAFPGYSKPSGYAILCEKEEGESTGEKASISGVALDEGGKLAGAHLPWIRVVADEIATLKSQGARDAIEEALSNLSKGTKSFKFFGLANPESWFDLSGYYAAPKDGRASITIDSEVWETKFGRARHHDGLKSPAIVEPDGGTRYPYLISQRDIDRDAAMFGKDSPIFFRMNRGYPPQQGSVAAVISETEIVDGKATDPFTPQTDDNPFFQSTMVGSLDSAFSQGGDSAILQPAELQSKGGLPLLCFHPPERIPIAASSERPITFQLTDYVRGWSRTNGVPMSRFAADASGNQSVSDVLTVEVGTGVLPMNYSAKASKLPTSVAAQDPANKRVKNLISEAYAILVELIKYGQVRGLSEAAAAQIVARQYITKGDVVIEPRALEPKSEFKSRTKLGSPDEADAAAQVAYLVRHRLGVVPGANVYPRPLTIDRPGAKPPVSLRDASTFRKGTSGGDPFARMAGRYKPT